MIGIIITSHIAVVKTESLFPHFQDKCPGPGCLGLGRPGVANTHGLTGTLITAKLEAAPGEGLGACLGALAPLTRVNRNSSGIFERFEKVTNIICLLLLWTQDLQG